MGAPPPNPHENKKQRIQTLPVARVPRTTGREEWGLLRPQAPNQEQCPWTLSVGASHTRYEAGDTPAARKHPGQLQNKNNCPDCVVFTWSHERDGSVSTSPDPLLLAYPS